MGEGTVLVTGGAGFIGCALSEPLTRAFDRVVALDAINTLVVAAMIVLGVVFQQIIFIDVAIIYALLSYVGTLFIAKYLGGEL